MRGKKLLAAFLLGVGLCFVPALGHGKLYLSLLEKASYMEIKFLRAQVRYMMRNPGNFLTVYFNYDPVGYWRSLAKLPEKVDTEDKIVVRIYDCRGVFSGKSEVALRDQFKMELKPIYSFMKEWATNMETDIVAIFYSRGGIPLGYFYQGEYHLWEK